MGRQDSNELQGRLNAAAALAALHAEYAVRIVLPRASCAPAEVDLAADLAGVDVVVARCADRATVRFVARHGELQSHAVPRSLRRVLRRYWLGYSFALSAVALVSVLIGAVLRTINLANVSMLYLLAVLATAVAFGRAPAVFASIVAFLTFDWFFIEPVHEWTVASPEQWVSLLLFLLSAIVTGQLAADQRRRAQEAHRREREATLLYDVLRLISDRDLEEALGAVAERLRQELSLSAVAIELSQPDGRPVRIGAGAADVLSAIEVDALAPADALNAGHWRDGLRLVPLRADDRRVGSLLLVCEPDAATFDQAADRLISAVAAQLILAIERGRLRREATQAEILRRTDDLRRALLNAVSHDLRTPLASIVASAGSLEQDDVEWTDEERRDFARAIVEQGQRLNRIVGNLLDLSRIEGGTLRPERGWYDLSALVEDVLGRLRQATAGHSIEADVPEDFPAVLLDYVEIDQVLSNLIENAAKFSPVGTPIELAVRRANGEVHVTVTDVGPGIPAASLVHLFDPFYRVADGAPRPAGLGLGLAVAKGLVEAHGGRIWAENRMEGGARFVFTLPVADTGPDVEPLNGAP